MAENKEEKKPEEVKENKKDEKEFKYKIATVGNVLLAILVILFMGTDLLFNSYWKRYIWWAV